MRRFKWDRKYLYWGITAFCVIAACILFYMALRYIPAIGKAISGLFRILSPFIWGLVLTYLMLPSMRFFEKTLFAPLCGRLFRKNKKGRTGKKLSRALSVLLSEICLLLILAALVYLIIPQLYSSIETIVVNSNTYLEHASTWLAERLSDTPAIEDYVTGVLDNMSGNIVGWLTGSVLPGLGNVVTNVAGGVVVVVKGLYNLVIGIVVSVYLLGNIEDFGARAKRVLFCIFTVEAADKLGSGLRFTNRTFMDYISSTLLDAAIIGILCYVFCAVAGVPYALLVSAIVCVTNVIPFFGPFIGAIPSALLILLVDPFKCLIFVIFIIVLQQCDGNIIKPKLLGSSMGLNGFWVLFAIIVGGGLFGFWGMLLGVPVFTVLYSLISNAIAKKLKRSDLPVEVEEYMNLDRIDPVTRELIRKEKEKTPAQK